MAKSTWHTNARVLEGEVGMRKRLRGVVSHALQDVDTVSQVMAEAGFSEVNSSIKWAGVRHGR
jgi:hypothetical protein